MYSCIKSVQYLIALLKEYGIDHLVLSAGARNVPFVHSVETDPYFKCYSVVDERSAAFFAMGLAMKLNKPVAISCTSATACCNYLSGVTEAFYHKIPILILTSDRDPYYMDQMETLMIHQEGMYRDMCKKSVQLPIIKNEEDEWYCKRIICEALLELNHHGTGPVQINIPTTSGVSSFTESKLPKVTPILRYDLKTADAEYKNLAEKLRNYSRILVIAGQQDTVSDELNSALSAFAQKYNCIVSKEHTANIDCEYAVNTFIVCELTNQKEFEKEYAPELIISFGGNFASSKLKTLLRGNSARQEHWLISEEGKVMDTYKCQTKIFECRPEFFFEKMVALSSNTSNNGKYYRAWKSRKDGITLQPDLPMSNLMAISELAKTIPENAIIHTSILNSTRILQYFDLPKGVTAHCNLAAYGIDGCMSTFIGYASVCDEMAYMLIGDLSFFYDMNSIWIRHIKNNVRIMLINNEGGAEFHFVFGKDRIPTINAHTSAEHHVAAKNWVEANGFTYLSARNPEELKENMKIFHKQSDTPIVFEIFTDKELDSKTVKSFYAHNGKLENTVPHSGIRKILGEQGVNMVKKLLK